MRRIGLFFDVESGVILEVRGYESYQKATSAQVGKGLCCL